MEDKKELEHFNPDDWEMVHCDWCNTRLVCPSCNKYGWEKKKTTEITKEE